MRCYIFSAFHLVAETIGRSIAFLLYTLIVTLIHLYGTSGRNAVATPRDGAIELTPSNKWYTPVPAGERDLEPANHVIGDDD